MTEYNPRHSKPGDKKRKSKIWNKKARLHAIEIPKEKHCRRCNIETGKERFAHYEGFRKSEFGKGTGQKASDNMTAFLCQKCTDIMDKTPNMDHAKNFNMSEEKKQEVLNFLMHHHSEEWLYLICKTHLL